VSSLVGRHIGRYRILEQLGQGGMSVVYKGFDTTLDREVAVKVLHPHLSGKVESRKRLAREAKAVAKLHHPNILEVFDFAGADSTESEEAFIVTEYIRGQTLRQFADGQAFDPPEVAAMVVHEIATALAHAHEAGVIHRDLKPENVMVREDGVLKLMDFGIAKILDRDERMTMTGALVGSPAHMAPEIIEGEESGAEADVFSLGTILYAFTTARLPFTGPNTTATLKRILDGQYDDPRAANPKISDGLVEIIATCLKRLPADRYPNASKLRDALAEHLASLGLERPGEELTSFFADPPSYRLLITARLCEALLKKAEALIAEQRTSKALASLDQVLALQPDHPRALARLDQLNRAKRRQKQRKQWLQSGAIALGAAAVVSAGVAWWRTRPPPPDFAPAFPELRGAEVRLPATIYPAYEPPAPVKPIEPVAQPVKTDPDPPPRARPTEPGPPPVPVTITVRPFGYLQVDGQPRSADQPVRHALQLAPGKHRFKISCEKHCVDRAEERAINAQGPNELLFVVKLKPSQVSFDYDPPDALVKVGDQVKTARESVLQPFMVETPPEKTFSTSHALVYEVTKPGFKPRREEERVPAGDTLKLKGKLDPE
jgi:serine/threonine protein kinase